VLCQLPPIRHPDLLVGLDWHDDAGVFRLTPDLAVIQTVDYFTPVVDDPYDFGEIAAANSLSDVYAMGGEPVTAMNIVGFPTDDLDFSVLARIIQGGHAVTERAGAVLVGGHSVKSPELFYGLAVLGKVHPEKVVSNAGARPGDQLVLTKPIGTGILTTALKKGILSPELLKTVTAVMKRLNDSAARLMVEHHAHGCTDVTGFGLLGHLHEMASASGVAFDLFADRIPLLEGAIDLARAGSKPGGLKANRTYLESPGKGGAPRLVFSGKFDESLADLLFDPQTSGGLLISLPAEDAPTLVSALQAAGAPEARVIGEAREGTGEIRVRF